MIESIDDNLIVQDIKSEDLNFEDIYNSYFERVYKFISYRVFNKSDIDDITSVVFHKVYLNLKRFNGEKGSFEVWLFTLARNCLNDYFRRQERAKILSIESFKDFFASEKYVEDSIEKLEKYEFLRREIRKLKEREQLIIGYKFGARLSNGDIATLMNLSVSNVGVILHRSITTLKKRMEAYYE